MRKLIAALIAAGLLTGAAADSEAAPKKKKPAKAGLSAAEKADLRKKYMPICIKQYAQGGNGVIMKVEVQSDGTVYCWYRN